MENKICPFCGEEVKKEAIKCKHCNEWLNKLPKFSRYVSLIRFVLLYLATFGFYAVVWTYDQWSFLKKEKKTNISPTWRAFFVTIWAGFLAKDVKSFLEGKNIRAQYSSLLVGISFFVMVAFWRLPDPYWVLGIFSFIPLLPILDGINKHYDKVDADLLPRRFSWWQIILLGVGLLLLVSAFYQAVPGNNGI